VFGPKYSDDNNEYIDELTIDNLQLKYTPGDYVGSCLNIDIVSGITKMFI
jgi:hypothetical protein